MKHQEPEAVERDWALEIKRTSITRLKQKHYWHNRDTSNRLEIKRTSITRLKRLWTAVCRVPRQRLEIKRTSITRLKQFREVGEKRFRETLDLKSKEPRLRDWNSLCCRLCLRAFSLEIKRTSITRLKLSLECHVAFASILEIKRTSITRLKHCYHKGSIRRVSLEIKRTSITRLKPTMIRLFVPETSIPWNQKNLDYEIETKKRCVPVSRLRLLYSWNQKNLDYEIETQLNRTDRRFWCWLEIKRTSITRLKRDNLWMTTSYAPALKSKEPRLRDWNITVPVIIEDIGISLKSKEPRLRDWNILNNFSDKVFFIIYLKSKEPRLRDWNNLIRARLRRNSFTWNQKNLDYEIETRMSLHTDLQVFEFLKSKEPRLRDWNYRLITTLMGDETTLEIKRTSITRLKLFRFFVFHLIIIPNLKSKEPRLRDWN